ncbi:MAG: polyprenyl synthetase family protein, partial [Polyangiaceae bacterium]|nr:polyprenyl synthetase family protein [Polyangiaceae bacterium]
LDWNVLTDAGVALELLQAYFLIHDDWMDEDKERRGGPTAHISLAKTFRSRHLGDRAAILAGDHAVALAQEVVAELSVSPKRLVAAMKTFAWMQVSAVAGQQLDIISKTPNPELTYELKTASYTVQGPLRLGAELAGAKQSTLKTLDAYGLPAGIAFQLRDDLIGVFEDSAVTGKPQGNDLRAGKNTVLVREGMKRLDSKEKAILKKVFGNMRASESSTLRAMHLLEDCGARAIVEERIHCLVSEAMEATNGPGLTLSGRKQLRSALSALCHRQS